MQLEPAESVKLGLHISANLLRQVCAFAGDALDESAVVERLLFRKSLT